MNDKIRKGIMYILMFFIILTSIAFSVNGLNITTPTYNQSISTNSLNISWINATNYIYTNISILNSALIFKKAYCYQNKSFINYFDATEYQTYSTTYIEILSLNTCSYVNEIKGEAKRQDAGCAVYLYAEFTYLDGSKLNTTEYTSPSTSYTAFTLTNPQNNLSINNIKVYKHGSCGASYAYHKNINISMNNTQDFKAYIYGLNLLTGQHYINVSAYNSTGSLTESAIQPFYLTTNAQLNITAKNGSTTINTYSVNITDINTADKYYYSTTTGLIQADLIKTHNYSIFIDATGYAYQTLSKSISSSYEAIQFNLIDTNSIYITIKQENNSNLILNSTHTLIGNLGSIYTKSTTNGYINWTNLPADTYKDSIVSAGYSTKEYSFTIADRTTQNLTAYLNSGTALLLTTKTGIGAIISGAFIQMSTFVNGTLVMVENKYTDIQGQAQFAAMNNTFYSFNVTKTGYVDTYFSLNPVLFSSYEIIMSELEGGVVYNPYYVTGNASYNNVTKILTFSYVSLSSNYSSYSWKAEVTTKPQYILICSDSSTSLTNTFTCNLTGYTGNIYVSGEVDGYLFYGGFLDIEMGDNIFDELDQKDASFISGFIALIIVIGGVSFGIFGAIVSGIIALLAIYWIGILTPITLTFMIVAIIISIIIALGLKRN